MATKQKYLQKKDKYLANICLFFGYGVLCSLKFQSIETICAFSLAYLAVRKYVYFQIILAICILTGMFRYTEIYGQNPLLIIALLIIFTYLMASIYRYYPKKNREKKSPKTIVLDTVVAILLILFGYALYASAR